MEYTVIKRITNDYEVIVEADSPEDAIRQAYENNHEPGRRITDYNDGVEYKPTQWIVLRDDYPVAVDRKTLKF